MNTLINALIATYTCITVASRVLIRSPVLGSRGDEKIVSEFGSFLKLIHRIVSRFEASELEHHVFFNGQKTTFLRTTEHTRLLIHVVGRNYVI